MNDRSKQLTTEIRRRVAQLGYEVVDLRWKGTPKRTLLQIRVDRPDSRPGEGITVDECGVVSRELESWLDESGTLGNRYVLEVSSPGIERPVRWPEHWQRYVGHDVRVRLPERGRVQARIVEVSDDLVVLQPRDGSEAVTVPFEEAREATLLVDWDAIDKSVDGRQS